MNILVLNSGSSSIKFQLIQMENETVRARGVVERIGSSDAIITYKPEERHPLREIREILNHETGIEMVLSLLLHPQHGVIRSKTEIQGIGHRVVHGGEDFASSVRITSEVRAAISRCIQFAPLHNPHNLKGIEACDRLLAGVPQVAVFDTAFHHSIPAHAFLYGLPYALYKKLGIRRYGFHGTSHRYVAMKAAEILNTPLNRCRLITCHLGNGASITAVDRGKSVDTTMGFTPLEGLVMGTRCGDIDPALVPFIMEHEKLTTRQIDSIMNKNSGMLGLTETSNDMREIEDEAERGSERHRLALEIYCYRIRKYIGAYMAVLGKIDALVFTGGVGEHSPYVRGKTLRGLENYGIRLDEEKNTKDETEIASGRIKVLVIPTNEELAIARDTRMILESVTEEKPGDAEHSKEITDLSRDDRAELVLLWAENPESSTSELARIWKKRRKDAPPETVIGRELEFLGLNRVSEQKKRQIAEGRHHEAH
ncbi:MAG TPA: acetate kinase [bacterium]|nr:acetate kinase [bacterium]